MKNSKIYLMSALSGLLYVLAFPPMPFNFLAFIFIIPLLFALEQKPTHWFRLTYLTFLIQHLGTLWWVGSWQEDSDPFLMIASIVLCVFHPFFYFVPLSIYRYIRKRSGLTSALLALPFIWAAFEWGTSLSEWAFPWISVGYSQTAAYYWNQFADIGGLFSIGLVIMAVNVLVFKLITNYSEYRGPNFKNFISMRENYLHTAAIALLFIVPTLYSLVRLSQFDDVEIYKTNRKLNIAIIQPNINPWQKWSRDPYQNIADHQRVQDSLRRHHHNIELSLWSETSITYANLDMNSRPYNLNFLQRWADSSNLSILSGFSEIYLYPNAKSAPVTASPFRGDSSKFYQSFNSAILMSPERFNDSIQIYRKMILTPVSERIPYVDVIEFAKDMLRWDVGISNWGKGWHQSNLTVHTDKGDFKVAPIICIESINPNFVRKFAALGAGIFTIITNDAWYNYTFGPPQHFAIAQMRAIENKRYLARCANGGISGFISPTGRIINTAEQYQNSSITESIPELNDLTIYSRFGDWIGYISLIVFMGFVGKAFYQKSK